MSLNCIIQYFVNINLSQCDLPNDTVINVLHYQSSWVSTSVIFHSICFNDDIGNSECFLIDDLHTNDLAYEPVLEHRAAILKNIS